ncbi:MAG: restriction endonuclease, partial [Bacteroidetes bacterium]|nr:restriction endonuclease [Bacteroidota bacterium]
KDALSKNPKEINLRFLKQFPGYLENAGRTKEGEKPSDTSADIELKETPEEIIANNFLKIRKNLALELLSKVKVCTPAFFENLVVELLVKMGYGGTIKEAGKATRLTSDGGIDGIIKEDKLGLDFIYIQAKRWDNQSVGRPDIQSFVGALDGQRATKGVFITTSKFADTAIEYVKTITKKVILIDGEQLTNYMIDYGLGVSTFTTYDLKKVDHDYFGED